MIETYMLEALRAFYENGTMSAAAKSLHVSEPSVSRALNKLEGILEATLFERGRNKASLNKTGIIAAEHAIRILESESNMIRHVRDFDKNLRTISIGICAPGPIMALTPIMTESYSESPVSYDMESEEDLEEGLRNSRYNIIILSRPLEGEGLHCRACLSEHLFASVIQFHPAAMQKSVTFREMDGQNFIMYAKVGIWEEIVRRNMPNAKFFKQEDLNAVSTLSDSSDLPAFSTDISQKFMAFRQKGRINVPFSDPEATVQFWAICRTEDRDRFKTLYSLIQSVGNSI